ncbi:hypothetical protein ACFORL_09755 [Legionella dresdenensis]|uniref:AAA domain (Dynein-related subfamily) n=1 Tax=Legionella dresdenensis TaxID=450200 RepID=A0ABV8CH99_9GAMM
MTDLTRLYLKEKTSKLKYSATPKGSIDIDRLLRGLSYWRTNSPATKLKPKALVLADWRAGSWSEDKIEKTKHLVKILLEKQFPIYIWQGSHLLKITTDNIDLLDDKRIRKNITPDQNKDIIKKTAADYKLGHDQVHIINDYWLDYLLEEQDDPAKHNLDVQDVLNHNPPKEYSRFKTDLSKNLAAVLPASIPPVTTIIHSQFSDNANDLIKQLNGLLPQAECLTQIKSLELNQTSLIILLQTGTLVYHGSTFTLEQLADIEQLKLSLLDSEAMPDLTQLLLKTPKLKTLIFNIQIDDFNLTERTILPCLENIIFKNGGTINDNFIDNLVAPNAQSLKKFKAPDCEVKTNGNTILSLPNMEELNFQSSVINRAQIQTFLTDCPKLKKINLLHCAQLKSEQEILEATAFTQANLSANNLNLVPLLRGPNVLATTGILTTAEGEFFLPDIQAYKWLSTNIPLIESLTERPAINRLSFKDCLIPAMSLQLLLRAAPNIKRLDISRCRGLAEAELTDFSLNKLEELQITNTPIAPDLLRKILSQASNLCVLSLEKIEAPDLNFNSLNLQKLEQLTISETNLSIQNLQNILIGTTRLKRLDLNKVALASEMLNNLDLGNLEELTLHGCDINDEALLTILAKAPKLYKIEIMSCPGISAELSAKIEKQGYSYDNIDYLVNKFKDWMPKVYSSSETSPILENNQHKLDADTKPDPNKTFKVERIFHTLDGSPAPSVNHDRRAVFNAYSLNPDPCVVKDAFNLFNRGGLDLIERPMAACQEDVFFFGKSLPKVKYGQRFYGKQVLNLTHEWQAIGSRSANEVMTHYHVDPGPVEIAYSQRDNLYYIRTKGKPVETVLDFLIEVPNTNIAVPNAVKTLAKKIRKYHEKELKLPSHSLTGKQYLDAIEQQTAGACRHRALAFCHLLNKQYPEIQTRIVDNDCHTYVETLHNGHWVAHDLGGYPAKLEIQDNLKHKPPPARQSTPDNPIQAANDSPESAPSTAKTGSQARQWLERYFKTWETETIPLTEPVPFCQTLLTNEYKKRLVRCDSSEQVSTLGLALQAQCSARSRPVYYVNSPEDLACSAPFVKQLGDKGVVTKGPGGPLFDFLQANQDAANPPVLIVNYDNFAADDLVRFNSLLDDKRYADGTPLPKGALVIGLQNSNNPDCYEGDDFYSRFEQRIKCTVSSERFKTAYPALHISHENPDYNKSIQLFGAPDWKERLLGNWIIKGQDLIYRPGSLAEAIQSGKPIIIENGPWDDPEFVNFWQQAKVLGEIRHGNQAIKLPANFSIIATEGYDWAPLINHVQWREGLSNNAIPLNPGSFHNFLQQYDCDNAQLTLHTISGIIEASANKTIAVNLTRTLSEQHWAMLLTECRKHKVELVVHCAPGVILPPELNAPAMNPPLYEANADRIKVIESSDIDTSVANLLSADSDTVVIDISECAPHELIEHIVNLPDKEKLTFQFRKELRALPQALAANKKVILKGRFSEELADALAPWLLNAGTDQITLVTDKANYFNYLPVTSQTITADDKLAVLQKEYTDNEIAQLDNEIALLDSDYYDKEGLCRLKARLNYLRIHREQNSDKAWQGMMDLPVYTKLPDFDLTNSAAVTAEFNANRLKAVNQVLSSSPYALLTGLTAVGKTTFIKKVLKPSGVKVHYGENSLLAWANDQSDKVKVLFIDEANIGSNHWSAFEGLFNNPPTILIDGVLHPLTDKHKVIFAGNPLSYGGERIMPELFERHGNAIVFDPLPPEAIYEDSLKPVFANTSCAEKAEAIAHDILAVYRFLVECSTTEILISPRELQMMALLTASYHTKHPDSDPVVAAQHYAYQIGLACTPAHKKNEFEAKFKPEIPFVHAPAETNPEIKTKFIITSSRQPLCQQLDDLLNLYDFRRRGTNREQKFGGLGGIIIEGMPGVGKTELVINRLLTHGFKEAHITDTVVPEKAFYRMPVSMSPVEMEKLFLRAYQTGAVVIPDEINSAPMMERLRNDLLTGRLPNGKKLEQAGGLMIGTQNPITLAGRKATVTALARRIMSADLLPHPREEMLAIIKEKGVPDGLAHDMVNVFEQQAAYARKHNKQPAPTFRHLTRLAKNIVKGKIKAEEILGKSVENQVASPPSEPVSTSFSQQDKLIDLLTRICSNNKYWREHTRVGAKPAGVKQIQILLNKEESSRFQLISALAAEKYSAHFQFFHAVFRGRDAKTNELYRIIRQLKSNDSTTIAKVIDDLEAFQQQQTVASTKPLP